MVWNKRFRSYEVSQAIVAVLLVVVLALLGLVIWTMQAEVPANENTQIISSAPVIVEPQPADDGPVVSEEPVFDVVAVQGVLDEWVAGISGFAGVVIADSTGSVVAAHNAERDFFAASIYKLYVAYEGYRQLDSGVVDGNELYVNGHTRSVCLDLMIRESDSPCAEKLWVELGKQKLTDTLVSYGIASTDMTNIRTTASDAAKMLARILQGEGLSDESKSALLSSMENQPALYQRGLPSGFSSETTVYNKVGWNELVEWHDTAIIELASGEQLIVSVLTENVGTQNIRSFAERLESVLTTNTQ